MPAKRKRSSTTTVPIPHSSEKTVFSGPDVSVEDATSITFPLARWDSREKLLSVLSECWSAGQYVVPVPLQSLIVDYIETVMCSTLAFTGDSSNLTRGCAVIDWSGESDDASLTTRWATVTNEAKDAAEILSCRVQAGLSKLHTWVRPTISYTDVHEEIRNLRVLNHDSRPERPIAPFGFTRVIPCPFPTSGDTILVQRQQPSSNFTDWMVHWASLNRKTGEQLGGCHCPYGYCNAPLRSMRFKDATHIAYLSDRSTLTILDWPRLCGARHVDLQQATHVKGDRFIRPTAVLSSGWLNANVFITCHAYANLIVYDLQHNERWSLSQPVLLNQASYFFYVCRATDKHGAPRTILVPDNWSESDPILYEVKESEDTPLFASPRYSIQSVCRVFVNREQDMRKTLPLPKTMGLVHDPVVVGGRWLVCLISYGDTPYIRSMSTYHRYTIWDLHRCDFEKANAKEVTAPRLPWFAFSPVIRGVSPRLINASTTCG